MSKPRYIWWDYVKKMVKQYPRLRQEYLSLKETSVTAKLTGEPRGGGISDPTAACALRELPTVQQKELEAVERAINATLLLSDGEIKMQLIKLKYWCGKEDKLINAALHIPCSEATAKRWHGEFIRLVAENYGLLDKDDTPEPENHDNMVS